MRSPRNKRGTDRALALSGAALMAWVIVGTASSAGAQQDVQLEIRQSLGRQVRIALPALRALPGAAEQARVLHDVLRNDLENSMAFSLVDPSAYPDSAPGEPIPWDAWRANPAEALIQGAVEIQGDAVIAEFRLYSVQDGQQVTGKRYTQPIDSSRRIAHYFNDEAVLYYTGIRGVAATQVAFVSDREAPAGTPQKEIFIMDADGENERRITYDASIALSPSFSPQADRLAYQTYRVRDGIPRAEIYLILKAGGQRPRPLVQCIGANNGPAFSPDGTTVAYTSTCAGNSEIHLVGTDGGRGQRLTRNPASDVSPAWSPNGRQVVFVSDRAGSQQLYIMDATGLNTRRLTTPGGQKDDPTWQPVSGQLIAFTASTGGNNFDIFVYDLTNDRAHQLTRGGGRKEAPSWSPDGRQIVFEWARGDSIQIWAMGLDGSRQRMLTSLGNNITPNWGDRP